MLEPEWAFQAQLYHLPCLGALDLGIRTKIPHIAGVELLALPCLSSHPSHYLLSVLISSFPSIPVTHGSVLVLVVVAQSGPTLPPFDQFITGT